MNLHLQIWNRLPSNVRLDLTSHYSNFSSPDKLLRNSTLLPQVCQFQEAVPPASHLAHSSIGLATVTIVQPWGWGGRGGGEKPSTSSLSSRFSLSLLHTLNDLSIHTLLIFPLQLFLSPLRTFLCSLCVRYSQPAVSFAPFWH